MDYLLTVDFGSTFTKVTAVSTGEGRVIATAKAFTTIETDICVGLENAMKELRAVIGCAGTTFSEMFASSSAGGGLKMVACGLVPELTSKAARIAASGAGAKVSKTFSYELSKDECEQIFYIRPDIILLSGGTDGGNKQVIIENARKIAEIEGDFCVIAAGNKSASSEVGEILNKAGKHCVVCNNVMPVFNVLDTASAKNAIRKTFIERIIHAKGLDKAQSMMSEKIVPTPLAVFDAAELLSRGYGTYHGLGDLMAVDIGGATTDVYTMCDGSPSRANVLEKGLKEPFAKRSVEGDLGLRYGMPSLIETVGIENVATKANTTVDCVNGWKELCIAEPGRIAAVGSIEKRIDDTLAGFAAGIAIERHTGVIESVFTPFGETFMQTGKDLTDVKYVVGIGGPLINGENPKSILEDALRTNYSVAAGFCLKPKNAEIITDKKYIAAAMGLTAMKYPEVAMKIMMDEIVED